MMNGIEAVVSDIDEVRGDSKLKKIGKTIVFGVLAIAGAYVVFNEIAKRGDNHVTN